MTTYTIAPGIDTAFSTKLNFNFAALPPIGGAVAWLKTLTGTPALPGNWVEANGQTISDAASEYNGVAVPNLNASGGGTQRFLRGSTTSGTTGGSETHTHNISLNVFAGGNNYAFTTGDSTGASVPPYYEVVWIIRIK